MQLQRYIPNLFTLFNLFSGCMALVSLIGNEILSGFLWLCLGILFDFFDGFFARLFKVEGPLGVQLDSLADMVTSGVVPGYAMMLLILSASPSVSFLNYLGFVVTLGSAYRLAKFNIDVRQTDSFIGLPTPANAVFIVSLLVIREMFPLSTMGLLLSNVYFLVVITLLSTYMLNAEIRLFSLKIKKFSWKEYKGKIIFVLISLASLILFRIFAIPFVIVGYVVVSIFINLNRRPAS